LVFRVLGNKKYNGELIFKTKKDGEFRFELEKVVDDETFRLAEEKLRFVKGVRKANSREIYLLKGKVFCEDCGRAMWIEGSGKMVNGKSYRYYRCCSYKENWKNNRRGVGSNEYEICVSGKRGNKISKDKLDAIVWNALFRTLIQSDEVIKDFKKKYNSEKGAKNRFIGKKGYYEKELKKLDERKNKIMNLYLDGEVSNEDYKSWIKDEYEVNKKQIDLKVRGVDSEIANYSYVDKIESWMDLMKEELLKDYNIERKEDRKRILDKYIEKVFVKEVIDEDDKKKFEVRIGLRIGKQKGSVVYDLNKKRLSLKEKDNHFYILNNDFVAGAGLEPATFGL
jgi:hypothetical protein